MIDFETTEEQKHMVSAVSQLATKLRARIREFEAAGGLPDDVRQTAFEMGLGGSVPIAESHGGAGLGWVTAVLLEEALAHGDAAAPFALGGPGALASALGELATAEQASTWMARVARHDRFGAVAWSEPRPNKERAGFSTTAVKDGDDWVLNGEKAFVINGGTADVLLVFAQVDPSAGWRGIGGFIVERGAAGLKSGERNSKLGLDAAASCTLQLTNVRVPAAQRLDGGADFSAATLRFFAKEGLKIAARCVALSQAAFDVTLDYVTNRKAFGKPIGHFQAVAFTLADRTMDVDAARSMVWRAAWLWDSVAAGTGSERDALLHSGWAISFALEAAMKAADDGVQLHGGAGFMRDYPVEKFMRDAKQLQVCVMTSEQADQLAAAVELGAPLDPALVLPTPETQAVFT